MNARTDDAAVLPAMPPGWVFKFFNPIARFLLAAGVPLGPNGLITIRGRKSGLPRTTPVANRPANPSSTTKFSFFASSTAESPRPGVCRRRSVATAALGRHPRTLLMTWRRVLGATTAPRATATRGVMLNVAGKPEIGSFC
jgi:hypothetical protein